MSENSFRGFLHRETRKLFETLAIFTFIKDVLRKWNLNMKLTQNSARHTNSTDLNTSGASKYSCDTKSTEIRLDKCFIIPFNK